MISPFFPTAGADDRQVDRERLLAFEKRLRKEKVLSCLVIKDGSLFLEYYKNKKLAAKLQKMNSCTKSFIATLMGVALDQGVISDLDTPISEYFPALHHKSADPIKRSITLYHLLTMTAGFDWPEFGEWKSFPYMFYSSDWVRFVLERPLLHEPGEKMNYNSGCSHLLSAVLQKASGVSTYDFAKKHLLEPLKIQDSYWYTDGQGIPNGGDGLRITSMDMAKLGLLYLQKGQMKEKQVVSDYWIQEFIKPRFLTYERIGSYGCHWWSARINPEKDWTDDNWFYFALGFGGQYILVVPSLQLVVVFTSELYDQSLHPLSLFRTYVLPAIVTKTAAD
jgi:CubicO group peptidase (beta-lactamase class C family)